MSTAQLKRELHEYIDVADDRLLLLIHGMFQADKQDFAIPGEPMSHELLLERIQAAKKELKKVSSPRIPILKAR